MDRFEKLYDAVLNADSAAAVEIVREALDEGVDPLELTDRGMIPAMREAGDRLETGEYFIPELLRAAQAMKAAMELIRPMLAKQNAKRQGRVVIGTVQGDLHDIGKNLVGAMLEGAGFEVVDMGEEVAPERFVEAVKEHDADLLGLSALVTVTMPAMKSTIDALEKAGLRDQVKVMVGGAPLTAEYASEIGADGYASNAGAAVRMALEFVGD
jgi:5-methyltetrahydrofolate--homocysteine methyltransferase